MATSYSVFVKLQADGAEKTASSINKVGTSSKKAATSTDILTRSLGLLTGALSVGAIVSFNDAWISYTNILKSAGVATEDLAATQEKLFKQSQQLGIGIKETAEIYRAIKVNTEELGISEKETTDLTRALSEAILQSGASAQQIQGGIIQLAQVFEKGKLQAQEFNSILTDFPQLGTKLRQAYLQASGGSETLREAVNKGSVDINTFIDLVKTATQPLDDMQKSLQKTSKMGFTEVINSMEKFVGKAAEVTKINEGLVASFNFLSNSIDSFSNNFTKDAKDFQTGMANGEKNVNKFIDSFKSLNNVRFDNDLSKVTGIQANTVDPKVIDSWKKAADAKKLLDDTLQTGASNAVDPKVIESWETLSKAIEDVAKAKQKVSFENQAKQFGKQMRSVDFSQQVSVGDTIFGGNIQSDLSKYNALVKEAQEEITKTGQVSSKTMAQLKVTDGDLRSWNSLKDIVDSTANSIASNFGSAVASIVTGSKSASEAFKDMANSIISDLIRISIEKATLSLFGSLAGSFFGGGSASSGGSISPGSISGGVNAATPSFQASSFAAPSPNSPANLSSFNTQPQAMNVVVNTSVTNNNQGLSGNSDQQDSQLKANQNAKLISNMVAASVQQELKKQQRVGGILYR
jgi:tape measure domain-containing protein